MDATKTVINESTSAKAVMILAGLEMALITFAIYTLSQLVGNKDTANELTKTTLPATLTLGSIILLHTALWYIYFTYNPLSMNLYFLLATSMCMVISLTALAVSMTNRS